MVSDKVKFSLARWTIMVLVLMLGTPILQNFITKYVPFLSGSILGYVNTFISIFVLLMISDIITRKVWAI